MHVVCVLSVRTRPRTHHIPVSRQTAWPPPMGCGCVSDAPALVGRLQQAHNIMDACMPSAHSERLSRDRAGAARPLARPLQMRRRTDSARVRGLRRGRVPATCGPLDGRFAPLLSGAVRTAFCAAGASSSDGTATPAAELHATAAAMYAANCLP